MYTKKQLQEKAATEGEKLDELDELIGELDALSWVLWMATDADIDVDGYYLLQYSRLVSRHADRAATLFNEVFPGYAGTPTPAPEKAPASSKEGPP